MSPSNTGPTSQAGQGTPGLPHLLYQSVPLGGASVQQPLDPRPLHGVCRRAQRQAWPPAALLPGPLGQRGPKGALLRISTIWSTLQFAKGSPSFLSVDPLSIPARGKGIFQAPLAPQGRVGARTQESRLQPIREGPGSSVQLSVPQKGLFLEPPFPTSTIRGSNRTTSKIPSASTCPEATTVRRLALLQRRDRGPELSRAPRAAAHSVPAPGYQAEGNQVPAGPVG